MTKLIPGSKRRWLHFLHDGRVRDGVEAKPAELALLWLKERGYVSIEVTPAGLEAIGGALVSAQDVDGRALRIGDLVEVVDADSAQRIGTRARVAEIASPPPDSAWSAETCGTVTLRWDEHPSGGHRRWIVLGRYVRYVAEAPDEERIGASSLGNPHVGDRVRVTDRASSWFGGVSTVLEVHGSELVVDKAELYGVAGEGAFRHPDKQGRCVVFREQVERVVGDETSTGARPDPYPPLSDERIGVLAMSQSGGKDWGAPATRAEERAMAREIEASRDASSGRRLLDDARGRWAARCDADWYHGQVFALQQAVRLVEPWYGAEEVLKRKLEEVRAHEAEHASLIKGFESYEPSEGSS